MYSNGQVEFLLGLDHYGNERWVVGSVREEEEREDGRWLYCEPAITTVDLQAAWVHADNVKPYARPDFGRRRGGRR